MHVRCPHCHNPLEVVEEVSLQDMTCPSCGSGFNLLGDRSELDTTTGSFLPSPFKKISHFELQEHLGQGHFGNVYKARDVQLDRFVAVKIPRRDQLGPEESEQFFREARAAAQLRHPNIVGIHEVGREQSTIYIVSDFVEGVDLAEWLTGVQSTPKEAAQLCTKIAEALHHAHEAGVVHRDLKPSNVMIARDGEPHIMDFGLAKREAGEITMTMDGKILGTPAYMSPEQARGESHKADARSDVYSMGVILFELLTGERPFRGTTRMLLHQVIVEDAPSPRKLNGSISGDLDTVCIKCLEKSPERRYQTANALVQDLKRYLAGEPIVARRVSTLERGWRLVQRNPTTTGLLSIVCVLLVAFAIGGPIVAIHQSGLRRDALRAKQDADAAALSERQSREDLRRNLYFAEMNLIADFWIAGDTDGAIEVLNRYRAVPGQVDLRGPEWYWWRQVCDQWKVDSVTSGGGVQVLYAPNGKRFAVTTGDITGSGEVVLRESTTNEEIHRLEGASCFGYDAMSFSPNGEQIATGGRDGHIRIWNVATGERTKLFKSGMKWVESIAFSSDGRTLACGGFHGGIEMWDVAKGSKLTELNALKGVFYLEFLPGDSTLVSLTGKSIKLWDIQSRTVKKSINSNARFLAVSPDGSRIAAGTYSGTIHLYDVPTFKSVDSWDAHRGIAIAIAFSPDGKYIASGGSYGESSVILRELETGRTATFQGHRSGVYSAAFSPDGSTLTTLSQDLKLCKLKGKKSAYSISGPVARRARFASDQNRLIAVLGALNGRNVIGLDVTAPDATVEPLMELSTTFGAFDLSPDGTAIAIAMGGKVEVWSLATKERLMELPAHEDQIMSLVFSPDGRSLASVSYDMTAKVWDLSGKVESVSFKHDDVVKEATFSPDASTLVCVSPGNISVWDIKTHELVARTTPGQLIAASVRFGPYGKVFFSGGDDGQVVMWDATTVKPLKSFPGHGGRVRCFAVSPDGKYLAVPTSSRRVKIWDIETGVCRTNLIGQEIIREIRFSNDGTWLATTSNDEPIRLWHASQSQY